MEPYLWAVYTDEDEPSNIPMHSALSNNYQHLAQDAPAEEVLASPMLGKVLTLVAPTLPFSHLPTHSSLIDNYLLSIVGEYLIALQHVQHLAPF